MEHLVAHPVELSFEDLLEAAMDELDPSSKAFGIARMVLGDPDRLSTLTKNQRYHWEKDIAPAMVRVAERHDRSWAKELMDRED